MKRTLAALLALVGLVWPFAVYFSLGKVAVAWLVLPLAGLWLLRALMDNSRIRLPAFGMVVFLLLLCAWDAFAVADAALGLRFYPVLVNGMLLAVFADSLKSGMPVIERLARLRHGDLPTEGVRYTRQVTQVWCVFFAVNGSVAALLALYGSLASWTWYNGFISYLLIAALLLGEWCVRPSQAKRV